MGVLGSVAAGDGMREVGEEPKELSFPAIQSLRFDAEKKIGVATTLYSEIPSLLVHEATVLLIELPK